LKLTVINTGTFKLDGGSMFGVVPKKMWQKLEPADDNNMCTWAMRCLLIEEGNSKILIDCGMGNKQDEKFFSHYEPKPTHTLQSELNKAGLSTDDITDVFLTHLHFDHCGGAVKRNENGTLETVFAKANYWTNEKHWNWAISPNSRERNSFLKENFVPIKESGQLQMVPIIDGYNIFPFMQLAFVYGHTEAMMLPIITIGNKKILYAADLFPSAWHIAMPYIMAYDMRPLQTLAEKNTLLTKAIQEDIIIMFEHDNHTECALIMHTDKGIVVNQKMTLAQSLAL
jgi:glyoxylase-like metal-dependent hydrolase (beta-lactamase superfamily II)